MGEPGNWGIQRGSKILGPALRGMKFKVGGGSDVGEMARRGEQAHSYQGGREGEKAETSDPSLQPISPKTLSTGAEGPTPLRLQHCGHPATSV